MDAFNQGGNSLISKVTQLRLQGLTDNLIMEELKKEGHTPEQIHQAIGKADQNTGGGMPAISKLNPTPITQETASSQPGNEEEGNIYERIEEITENMINEKWDELISEVKKIMDWKEKIEERQTKIAGDQEKIKEDFKILHQGVLGKLEDYDSRMQDVSTELKAVGKVFKDVVPVFVDNVKELKEFTTGMKKENN